MLALVALVVAWDHSLGMHTGHGSDAFRHHTLVHRKGEPEIPAKLAAAQHKMEISHTKDMQEIKEDDEKLDGLNKKLDVETTHEERRQRDMHDRMEKRLDDSQSALEAALNKAEKKNAQEGSELMRNFEGAMSESTPRHPRTKSSFLQTADKSVDAAGAAAAANAKAEQEQQLEARIQAEALVAAKTKLGSKMHDLLQSMADERYSQQKKVESDRAEQHRQLEEVKAGLQREKGRLQQYTAKEGAKRQQLMQKLTQNDNAFEKRLTTDEDKFEQKTKASEEKWRGKYAESQKKFKAHEKAELETLETAFDPSSFAETNMRQAAPGRP